MTEHTYGGWYIDDELDPINENMPSVLLYRMPYVMSSPRRLMLFSDSIEYY